ncbi:MAG: hypothetical protein WA152_02125 [Microgenomates group bacterium]
MQRLSKFVVFLFIFISYYSSSVSIIKSQEPIPELLLSCSETRDNEFHSLRPYQASPCGGTPPPALFCSNKLIIFEDFDMESECRPQKQGCEDCKWTCNLNYKVEPHNLNITLDQSEFPILGNTEDNFDDAQKVNEYASWYLNGVIDKRENEEPTNSQVVDFSGPVRKLIPSIIQDSQRIKSVESALRVTKYEEPTSGGEQGSGPIIEKESHDQLVVDNERLSSWSSDLSEIRTITNSAPDAIIGGLLGGIITGTLNGAGVGMDLFGDAWNKRTPPLPWDDGTVVDDYETPNAPVKEKVPFKSRILYQKAYNEWLGKSCAILPVFGLVCADIKIPTPFGSIDIIKNKYAELWNFVPLANNNDKKGKNYLLTGDGPNYVPSQGTEIEGAQHKGYRNAPLYFAHTQEVASLSALLNQTYRPAGFESEKLPETTEKIKKGTSLALPTSMPTTLSPDKQNPVGRDPYAGLDCSSVNVRVNEGDNLFPGDRIDKKELYVEGAEYTITQVECHEKNVWTDDCKGSPEQNNLQCGYWIRSLDCNAEVGIEFKTGTQTPYINEIYADTVADSGSTFRKIFPKVGEGSPVECIADIPTSTNVTYSIDNPLNQAPAGGDQTFKEVVYPADGANTGTELTFPHVGSVYEYFLKGIQTALRPKGYGGEPIANGNCKPTEPIECGLWEEKLEKSSGGDCGICTSELGDLAKRILATAGKAYNVPAANIWAAMKHEGADGYQGTTYDFSDENVRKWSTPEQCGGEPMPGCDNSVTTTQPPFGFLMNWFYTNTGNEDNIWSSVQKLDPTRDSQDKVSRCNFLDAAFAAANLLSQSSTPYANGIISCGEYTFDNSRPGTCSSAYWTDDHVAQSQTAYVSYCVNDDPNNLYTVETAVSWFNAAKCN